MTKQSSFRAIPFSPMFSCALLVAGIFTFWNLGAYSFWDDEAIDGLIARSIIENGRATALIQENLVGYREGALLHNFRIEGQPPFCAFTAIPCFKMLGQTTWAGRFFPALAGFATAFLMLFWVFQKTNDLFMRSLFCISLLCNTSFFLFSRQFHYYGPSMFFTVLIAYLWTQLPINKKQLLFIGISLFCLNLNNYLTGFLVGIALAFDYIVFRYTRVPLRFSALFYLFLPILLSGLIILSAWNPFRTVIGEKLVQNTLQDKMTLIIWGLRDLNQGELVSWLCLVAWVCILFFNKKIWALRLSCSILIFFVGTCLLSTQPVRATSFFDIRYLTPLLPSLIYISAYVIHFCFQSRPRLGLVFGIVILGTNLTHRLLPFRGDRLITSARFIYELLCPVPEPFSPVISWLKKSVSHRGSVWVLPEHMTYPLMFHAPDPIYAWQLRPEQKQEEQFKDLPDIHFKGLVPPDYIVVFGPSVEQIRQLMSQWSMQGLRYQEVTRLMTFWKDLYRPELFWRTFKPIEKFDPNTEAIYIFQRQS